VPPLIQEIIGNLRLPAFFFVHNGWVRTVKLYISEVWVWEVSFAGNYAAHDGYMSFRTVV
jgi:hypothetical protein